ncbi:MAG: hydrogenase, partial [Deltaproteobacteria bacterium]|nr:hydrogenase [Deltaproteobacteria bacterium]
AKWSDISVGALEGKSNWNTLIIRSERGEKLVNEAVAAGYLELDDFPAESLEHLRLGAGNKQERAIEKQKQEEACQS